jgi:SAM-dependent methyltransferase
MVEALGLSGHSRFARWQTAASDVQGWFSDMSAALWDGFLSLQAGWAAPGDMLEIGCAYGRAAMMMGLHSRQGETLRLLDAAMQHVEETPGRVQPHSPGQVIGTYGFSERLDPALLPARGTRFMHVDGDHGLWALHNDLDLAERTLTADGLLVLDDFLAPQFMGVTLGAIEWVARHPQSFEFVLAGFNKAYLARPRFAGRYLEYIRDALPAHLRALGQTDFSFWLTDDRRACSCFGMTQRQFDRDFITREFAMGLPDSRPDGKPEL